jgi:hypothetical protein
MRLIPERETIGPPDCPIIYRWTLFDVGDLKLMVHRFPGGSDDRDVHDHPRPFWTFVVWGGYDDLVPCEFCKGEGWLPVPEPGITSLRKWCSPCRGRGVLLNERMTPGKLRLRKAKHAHRTRAFDEGAWTIVLMGPLRRRWGFWRSGRWWFWRDYEAEFGFAMRCEDLDAEYRPQP